MNEWGKTPAGVGPGGMRSGKSGEERGVVSHAKEK